MKRLLAAAVAATMSATAMADISLTGNAKFEYTNTDSNTAGVNSSVNGTETEINLNVRGKNGDTKVVLDLEFDAAGSTSTVDHAIDVENSYITTKLGPVSAKLGNYDSSTSGIIGEIENGGRANDKMTFSYTTNGVKFYAGNSGTVGDDTTINNNMLAGVVATVEGWKLQVKKNNEDKNSFGVSGQVGPVGIRVEYADSKVDADTGYFANFTGKFDNINVGLAMIEMDANGGIKEDDSDIFAVSNDGYGDSNMQLSASMAVDGTTYSAKFGQMGSNTSGVDDLEYYELSAKRALASGITVKTSYLDTDTSATADAQTFEVDLSVKF